MKHELPPQQPFRQMPLEEQKAIVRAWIQERMIAHDRTPDTGDYWALIATRLGLEEAAQFYYSQVYLARTEIKPMIERVRVHERREDFAHLSDDDILKLRQDAYDVFQQTKDRGDRYVVTIINAELRDRGVTAPTENPA